MEGIAVALGAEGHHNCDLEAQMVSYTKSCALTMKMKSKMMMKERSQKHLMSHPGIGPLSLPHWI